MNTVKRFVCYYAGINLVLAVLLLGLAWVAPDDDGAARVASGPTGAPSSAALTTVSSPGPVLASAEMSSH